MSILLIYAYLFFLGSLFGWVLELFYRRFLSAANPERRWINPGFCVGPYVPLYGFGLCALYLFATLGTRYEMDVPGGPKWALFAVMALSLTGLEYLAGIISLKWLKVRLWDYSREWGNIQGIICPKFSFFWAVLGAVYYFGIHPGILDALGWLSENLAFSFVIGYFFGVFTIDVIYSAHVVAKLKQYAEENQVVVRYEALKAHIRSAQERAKERSHFLFSFRSSRTLREYLREAYEVLEGYRAAAMDREEFHEDP